jgi:hypothetical protein
MKLLFTRPSIALQKQGEASSSKAPDRSQGIGSCACGPANPSAVPIDLFQGLSIGARGVGIMDPFMLLSAAVDMIARI